MLTADLVGIAAVAFVAGALCCFLLCRLWSTNSLPEKLPLPAQPKVSARSWAVARLDAPDPGELLFFEQPDSKVQIASITKVATALLVLELCEGEDSALSVEDEIKVSHAAALEKSGTNAKLRRGDRFTVRELLYALLLPSGNDAAVALAAHFGGHLASAAAVNEATVNGVRALPNGDYYRGWGAQSTVAYFVSAMNDVARGCGATSTRFCNPHGLGCKESYSTARDVIRIARAALEHPLFVEVCATKRYTCTARGSEERPVTWCNTNALLGSETLRFDGVKTGWIPIVEPGGRPRARPPLINACLLTTVRAAEAAGTADEQELDKLLVVVLGSTSKELRFVDSSTLASWALQVMRAFPFLAKLREVQREAPTENGPITSPAGLRRRRGPQAE